MSELHTHDKRIPDDEILSDIFKLRRDIATLRQSRHKDRWEKLEQFIEDLKSPPPPYKHPFRLSDADYGDLSRSEVFADGTQGFDADPPAEGYLFRICSLESLVKFGGLREMSNPDKTFIWLEREYRQRGDWLPLGEYSSGGVLGEELGFTWWTSDTLSPEELAIGAQRLGLVLRGNFKALLRCRASHVKSKRLARVPTVLDAFANDIFHPTSDLEHPTHGVTISFQRLQALEEGTDEFVIAGLEVSQIEMRPVRITEEMRHACPLWLDGAKRLTLLQDYYRRLLKGGPPAPARRRRLVAQMLQYYKELLARSRAGRRGVR